MSDAVERRILALLDKPLVCPHGNPIPGLDELGLPFGATEDAQPLLSLTSAAAAAEVEVVIDRISEQLQPDAETMRWLSSAGMRPGRRIHASTTGDQLRVWADDGAPVPVDRRISDHVFVHVQ